MPRKAEHDPSADGDDLRIAVRRGQCREPAVCIKQNVPSKENRGNSNQYALNDIDRSIGMSEDAVEECEEKRIGRCSIDSRDARLGLACCKTVSLR